MTYILINCGFIFDDNLYDKLFETGYENDVKIFLTKLFVLDPKKRITATNALKDNIFHGINLKTIKHCTKHLLQCESKRPSVNKNINDNNSCSNSKIDTCKNRKTRRSDHELYKYKTNGKKICVRSKSCPELRSYTNLKNC